MKAKITAKLEISDHDGYCTDNECDYECSTVIKIIDVPQEYKNNKQGKICDVNDYDWIQFLDIPELNYSGSRACEVSSECQENGLGNHEYKYTIISVELYE